MSRLWESGILTNALTPSKLNAVPTYPWSNVAPFSSVPSFIPSVSIALFSPRHQLISFGARGTHVCPIADSHANIEMRSESPREPSFDLTLASLNSGYGFFSRHSPDPSRCEARIVPSGVFSNGKSRVACAVGGQNRQSSAPTR